MSAHALPNAALVIGSADAARGTPAAADVIAAARPPTLLDAADVEHNCLPAAHQNGPSCDAVLLTPFEQLPGQQQCRARAGVGHHQLLCDRRARPFGHADVIAAQVISAGDDGRSGPHREHAERTAVDRPAQVQVEELHSPTSLNS